jgi:hypothetical protein
MKGCGNVNLLFCAFLPHSGNMELRFQQEEEYPPMAVGEEGEFIHETDAARRAFDDYRSLGMNRSIEKLVDMYRSMPPEDVPTMDRNTLIRWSSRFVWSARCAEHEARLAEMSETLIVKDRAYRKRQRMDDYDNMASICRQLMLQLKQQIEPYYEKDEDGQEQLIYPLPVEKLVALLPRIGALMIQANQAARTELGEDVQRHHITIERVIDSFPAEYRQPLREALFENLELGAGNVDG